MFGFRPRLHFPNAFKRIIKQANKTMCWDHDCAVGDQCCHSMDQGMSYCCTEYNGFMFLGLMLGGGLAIALLIVICYLCMRKAERRLEEEAKLEALKTLSSSAVARTSVNGNDSGSAVSPSSSTSSTSSQYNNLNLPPPAYEQVIAPDYLLNDLNHIRRCQSCDPHHVRTSQLGRRDITTILARSLSENRRNYDSSCEDLPPQAKYYCLPSLPPIMDSTDKLPTYSECTSHVSQNSHSSEAAHGASSENVSSDITTRGVDSAESRGEIRGTSSLHRPIYIPIGLQQTDAQNCGFSPPMRLSTPTQVDDGTGIVVEMQTGVRQTSVENTSERISSEEACDFHQSYLDEGQEQVPSSTPRYTAQEGEGEHISNLTPAGVGLRQTSLEQEENQISSSAMSDSDYPKEEVADACVNGMTTTEGSGSDGSNTKTLQVLEAITEKEEENNTDGCCGENSTSSGLNPSISSVSQTRMGRKVEGEGIGEEDSSTI